MKSRRISAMLFTFVLLLNAAPSAFGAWTSVALAEEGTAEEQVLVYKTWAPNEGYGEYELVEAFNRTHPGKKVVVEPVLMGEALPTELMSGEADYILNVVGTDLDASKCAASGIFVDLYEWMDADPDFHRTDYFTNFFENLEYNGQLCGIMGHFYLSVVFLNRPIAEALGANYEPLDSITLAEILDLYEAAKAQGLMVEDTPLFFEDTTNKGTLILNAEFYDHVDMKEKTSHFSDPDFIELLERTKGIYSKRRMADGSELNIIPDDSPFARAILERDTSSLLMDTTAMLQPLQGGTLAEPPEGLMGPLVFESTSGGASAAGSRLIMVPKSCSNPELAWEFIKFSIAPLDEENGETAGTSYLEAAGMKTFPISKANLAAFTKYYGVFGDANFDNYLAKLEARIEEIHELSIYTLNASIVVSSILEQFFDYGTITAEECAKQMDERLYLYLNE